MGDLHHLPGQRTHMGDDDLSAHRTRTNRRPDPPLHPDTVNEIDQVMGDVIEDRD